MHTDDRAESVSSLPGPPPKKKDANMKTSKPADLRAEYDFGAGTRGQYAARYAEGSNVVVLAPRWGRAFSDLRRRQSPAPHPAPALQSHPTPFARRLTGDHKTVDAQAFMQEMSLQLQQCGF